MLAKDKPGLQIPHPLGEIDQQTYGFYTYLPSGYREEGKGSPLLVFLHGVGERGDNLKNPDILRNVLRTGPPYLINAGNWDPNKPMVVVSPQCHETRWFPDQVHRFFHFLLEIYHIDRRAIFLTGLSMGGFGTFQYLENYSSHGLVSAAVTICGGGNAANASSIRNVPVWAFHGDADIVVPPVYSIEMVNAINATTPKERAKLTVYPDVEHDSWTITYNGSGMGKESRKYDSFDQNIYDWMLGHRQGE
jgi:predicted peptidase